MRNYKKAIAFALALTLSAGTAGTIAYAEETAVKDSESKKTDDVKDTKDSPFKDETVYVLCNNDSSVKDIVVSDWLKNSELS